ncbi:carboxypeptidase regulatory-like domain-containing protein [Methylohalobius crimeensis]|uniref:carboxypeptidase regulatory-like domain-containing protein n=1 Tax=Methylohalobius crimeensis TaxID=244365 RepID=UPI001376BDDD|nr:carboxypeptidase regulatory-like domain-containing protein [Methylohalobius crimeensis]
MSADGGINWLATQAQVNGSYTGPSSLATPFQATAETLRTFFHLDKPSQPGIPGARQFLESDSYPSTEHLSRLILMQADAGFGVAEAVESLIDNANPGGGFGELEGYSSTALDTAFALEALNAAGYNSHEIAWRALDFLLNAQRPNGGWREGDNASSVYVTGLVLHALAPYRTSVQDVAEAISAARSFLFSKRGADGLWSEDFASATALMALIVSATDITPLQSTADALAARQRTNGSWSDDVFSTALALRALWLYQLSSAEVKSNLDGSVGGRVVTSGSEAPVANAEVFLASRPEFRVVTGEDGYFHLTGVPAGTETVVAEKEGYLSVTNVVTVFADQESNAGQLLLAYSPQSGIVTGSITDSHDQSALSGATVSLIGAQVYTTTTGARGAFELVGIAPGDYQVTVEKTGYVTASGQVHAVAGEVLALRQTLVRTGAFLDEAPGNVTGRVVDGATGSPIADARIALNGEISASTDGNGNFQLPSLARGSYQATLTADGYRGQIIFFVFNPGASGELGTLRLYHLSDAIAPFSLTLHGRVIDGVTGQPISGASIKRLGTELAVQSDFNGVFTLSELEVLNFELVFSAPGYVERTFTLSASGYGEFQQDFLLPPEEGDPNAPTTTLTGVVKNQSTGEPIAGANVWLSGDQGFLAQTDREGRFEIVGIDALEFSLRASAVGYVETARQLTLSAHGVYMLDIDLEPLADDPAKERFQVVSLMALSESVGADETVIFEAEIGNLRDQAQDVLVIGEMVNGAEEPMATVMPYIPGTTQTESQFSFAPGEVKTLDIPWPVAQAAPGDYQLILRVVEPGTVSRSLPTGVVLAKDRAYGTVHPSAAFDGTLGLQPPLTQAGTQVPVKLDALVVNSGNVPLENLALTLVIENPASGNVVHEASASFGRLAVSNHKLVSFGEWIPTAEGNLDIRIESAEPSIAGEIRGNFYVGDKATGTFAVDKAVVPEGTRTVRGTVTLDGVDTALGSTTDPLFFAVRKAVQTGGEYTAREAMAWQRRNRCMGCHIQTQSLVGVAAAFQKNLGDEASAVSLYNTIASSRQDDGGLRSSRPHKTRTQTALGAWSLSGWDDIETSFRTLYKAAEHLYERKSRSGNRTWWSPDQKGGWWYSSDAHTAMTVKAYTRLLNAAAEIDVVQIDDYRLDEVAGLGPGVKPRDLEVGPDGYLYAIKQTGDLVRIDPDTGVAETVGDRLPIDGFGLAIDADGIIYVSGRGGKLIRRHPDGTVDTLLSGSGVLTDVEIGFDGLLYVADYSHRRILKVTATGQSTVWAGGGVLNRPYGLTLDEEGNAFVANYGGFNIVKVDSGGTASIFTNGLQYRPIWIDRNSLGEFYFSTASYSSEGQFTPDALNHLSDRGVVERLASGNTLRGVAVMGGRTFAVSTNGNTLLKLQTIPLETTLLPNFAEEVARAANYFLARYGDNTSDNIVQAMRLTGLAEARRVVADEALKTEIDAAIDTIEQVLRKRQRADGGWGRYVGWGSDSMVTALVGIALDYTDPSKNDPLVRNTIQYLLSSQLSDHSWRSANRILTTRLAATSLVVTYLPVALERLGGIDVDLHLAFPENSTLSAPSIAPSEQSTDTSGHTEYRWQLLGVTSSSRQLDFDLTLVDLALGEERPVALEAYIEFQNSFNEEKIRVDLPIPTVRAESEMKLTLGTDRTNYQANDTVAIDVAVDNTGTTVADGRVELAIRAAGSSDSLAVLDPHSFTGLVSGEQLPMTDDWGTGTTLVGEYAVHARLLDAQDRLLDYKTAPFTIDHGEAPVIDARVLTDKPVYEAWDQVLIEGRVANVSENVIQPPTRGVLTVADPSGTVIYTNHGDVGELVPEGLRDLGFTLTLADAPAGIYSITWEVLDDFSHALLATRTTDFTVERQAVQGLTGSVEAAPTRVYQGDPVQCSEQVTNLAASDLAGVKLVSQLVRLTDEHVVEGGSRLVDLKGEGTLVDLREISTDDLAVGEYACVLTAEIEETSRQIGVAFFAVLEPPIRIEGQLTSGDRGRVLVLLDEVPQKGRGPSKGGNDPLGPNHRPDLPIQRTVLETLLTEAGWSYTVVTRSDDFARELRSGGYVAYLLLSEQVKLAESVQKELREAVYRGEGLVEAGGHDQRQGRIDEALGVTFHGKYAGMTGVGLLDSPVASSGDAEFQLVDRSLRASLEGATAIGYFSADGMATGEPAVTAYEYGLGRTVYAGIDLLAEASLTGADGLYGELMLDALAYVHPDDLTHLTQVVYPVRVALDNQGIATPGQVILSLPEGVTVVDARGAEIDADALIWPFDLAEGGHVTFHAWLKLPDVPVPIDALIQSGAAPDWEDQEALTLDLAPAPLITVEEAYALAAPIKGQAYKQVRKYLQWAQNDSAAGDWPAALSSLLRAADALIPIATPESESLREAVARAIRTVSIHIEL